MFSLTIAMGPMAWALLFKEKATATAARDNLVMQPSQPPAAFGYGADSCITVTDDFGQEASIRLGQISGLLLEDMDASKFAHVARMLHQARTEILGRQQAHNDPVIRSAQQGQGPGILTPFAPNGRGLNG